MADAVVSAQPDQEIFLVSQKAQVFRTSIQEIPPRGRNTQGVILWKPGSSDSVASVELVDQSRMLTFSSIKPDNQTAENESQPTTEKNDQTAENESQPTTEKNDQTAKNEDQTTK